MVFFWKYFKIIYFLFFKIYINTIQKYTLKGWKKHRIVEPNKRVSLTITSCSQFYEENLLHYIYIYIYIYIKVVPCSNQLDWGMEYIDGLCSLDFGFYYICYYVLVWSLLHLHFNSSEWIIKFNLIINFKISRN
jgi:hypothetical protein